MTGTPGHTINGNISVASGATLNFNPASAGTVNFNGASAQTISNSGTLTFAANQSITIANTSGVTVNSAVTLPGTTTVNANTTLAAGASVTNTGTFNVNGTLQINQNGFFGGAGTYTYNSSTGALVYNNTSGTYGPIDSSHTYWPASNGPQNVNVLGAGGINLGVARTVGGTFQTAAGVTGGNNLTLNGTCQINAGGFFNQAPTYGGSSTLIYNTPAGYNVGNEWTGSATTAGAGVPQNVTIQAGTVTMPNSTRGMAGNLNINDMFVLNGTSGDLNIAGNWTRAAAGAFNPNNRAVFFNGSGTQTITVTGGGPEMFSYLVVNKPSGNLQLATTPNFTTISIGATTGNVLQLINAGGLDLNGSTLSFPNSGGNILVDGGARSITSSQPLSQISFNGAKTVTSTNGGTLTFGANVNLFLFAGVDFGAGLSIVQGFLSVNTNGFVSNNPPTYAAGSTLYYDTNSSYNAAAEFPATGVQNVQLAGTTQLNLNGDKTIAGTFTVNDRTVNSAIQSNFAGSKLGGGKLTSGVRNIAPTVGGPYSLSAASISIGNGTLTLNNVTTTTGFNATGAAGINVAGNWNVAGFSAGGSTVNFNGTGAQAIQTASTFNNLTAANDLSLSASPTVNGVLALGARKITTGANTLALGNAASITRTTGYVLGTLSKSFNAPGSFTYAVGTANGYSPVDANATTGTGSLSVKPTETKQPNIVGTNALSRYWTLAGSGITTNLTFHYLAGDVVGTESNYQVVKYTGTTASVPPSQSVDTNAHTATVNGVNSFSDWTLAEPAAVFGQLQFASAPYTDSETNADHTFTVNVSRTGGASGAVSVDYAVTDGTATTADNDYSVSPASSTLNWADGDTANKSFNITVKGDTTFEPNETVNLTLSNPTGGAVIGSPNPTTLTITNDDAAAPANVVYVDDDWTGLTPGTDPDGAGPATSIGYDAFATIQGGINAVATGGTVNVAAGSYVENPAVSRAMTLLGANANTPGAGTRGAESNVRTNGNQLAVFGVTAANVTINGFLIDGDDPAVTGIPLQSGDDTNASYGVRPTTGAVSNLTVSNNIIRKVEIGLRGDVASQGNTINANWFDSIGHFDFGYCVSIRNNFYANVTNNKMTRAWTGVHVNNHNGAGGPAAFNITGNEIHAYAGGILYWLQFNGATSATINNNQITAETTGAVANNFGVLMVSIQNAVNASFTNNTITGHNYGVGLFNVPTSNNITLGATNSITGSSLAGVFLTDNLNFNPIGLTNFLAGGPGAASTVNVTGLAITGNTGDGVKVEGTTNAQTVNVSGATVTGSSGTRGIEVVAAQGHAAVTSSTITGFATGVYLDNATGGPQTSSGSFNRIVGNTAGATTNGAGTFSANWENNWWGCNAGPNNTGCGSVAGPIDFDPWLILTVTAAPTSVSPGGMSTVTADFFHNSDMTLAPEANAPAVLQLPPTPVSFSATNGMVSPANTTTANGAASTTFTSTSNNTGTVTATADNQMTSANVNVVVPDFSINDVTHNEGDSGTTDYTFTVTKTNAGAASVDFTTVDGTAKVASNDYVANSGTLSFASGDATKTITVQVNGDTHFEPTEAFTVHLSNAVNATISDADGTGTITNDDPAPPPPNPVCVDDDFASLAAGDDPPGPCTEIGYDAFATIQAGVNAVAAGGTVNVAAGTYDEDVTISNAGLQLLGAGAGVTNIRGPIGGPGTTVIVAANNVTVAGFTITRLGNNTTDWNNSGLNTAGIAVQGTAVTGMLIRDNVLTGNRTAIDINNSGGHTVRNNTIDFNRTGLIFRNRTDNITVTENFITNNWTVGVLFLDASGGTNSPLQQALHSAFNNNDISANWYAQIVDRQTGGSLPAPGTTNLKNFRRNWFGTTAPVITTANSAEPGYAAQIPVAYGGTATPPGGQPDIAGPASANFKIDPILLSGTDTNVETTPGRGTNGFQGVQPPNVVVRSNNLHGWVPTASSTATVSFVPGPATPPLGEGSAQLAVGSDGDGAAQLRQTSFNGTSLSDLTALSYSTYTSNDGTPPMTGDQTIYIILNVDRDADGTLDTLLFFEPEYQHGYTNAVPDQGDNVLNTWQTWNARVGGWYGIDPSNGDPVFAGPGSNVEPLDNFITAFPNARLNVAASGSLRLVAGFGAGSWDNFVGNVDNVTVGVSTANTTYDFEPLPRLSINDVTHNEGDSGTTDYTFTVSLSSASDQTVTVDYATADDSATAPSDYTAVPTTTLTFDPGQTSKQVTVQVNGDIVFEPTEQFFVNLSNVNANATISDGQGVGTITNDDAAPVGISINDVFVSEPAAGTSTAVFTVTLSGPPSAPVTVDYATQDGTATAPADYVAIPTTQLTFGIGETTKTISVTVNADGTAEGNENFFVNLSNPSINATIADGTGQATITDPVGAGQLLISEFRFRGPTPTQPPPNDGARDEYVELYNNTDQPMTVATTDGSAGWALAALDATGTSATVLVTIPSGTVIPTRGHLLAANGDGYTLTAYAPADATYFGDVADDAGVAVFTTANAANFSTDTRLDAAGFSAHAGATADLYREGAGLTSPGANDGEYAFLRQLVTGLPQDSQDNAADFVFVATDGALYGGAQSQLGAPGPEDCGCYPGNQFANRSPTQRNAQIKASLIDQQVASTLPPNRVRLAPDPAYPQFGANGTLDIRRRFRNTMNVPVTRLRFRIVDVTTLNTPNPGGQQADLRWVNSNDTPVATSGGVITVKGTVIEMPPAQGQGGGLNTSGTVTTFTPIAPGATVDVRFVLGVQAGGRFRFFINVEALP